ncbi:hypothetical protein [Frigoribacterium sp. CG_9.8]|uniref:hypothetical protein n=1 Tax=Frigoribacterium sp. CG_9.8 TaxID=2787733 RepID=UPI0018CAA835|nr:hypothetical protein [Frigoribacterium sp. CG_9.8]MBG6106604.1 hypothetical protein [Frigoribacterium sp. CG_9.8]
MTLTVGFVGMNTHQAIEEAGRVWRSTITPIPEVKKRIRREAEEKIEREIAERREVAARAINYAIDHGATKVALRKVTTKDHYGFEEYVSLGAELAREEAAE